jgi:hypothetical protein
MTNAKALIRKYECEVDGLYFARYFFKHRFDMKLIVNWHHYDIQSALDLVLSGEIKRLIINLPPGYTKTELAVISFMARGLALNHSARFLHLSSSSSLALENSATTRNIVSSAEYQEMWPIGLRDDADSKQKWWTTSGGGIYAASSAGQVMGFRAGHMAEGFTGALVIDDPIKPDDSETKERKKVNNRFNSTAKSRTATEDVPIIVIMQRLHAYDLSGYLLRGGSGEKWHHLCLSVNRDNEPYQKEYTHGIPIPLSTRYEWLWPFKHNQNHEVSLRSHKRTFWSQYMQRPEKCKVDGALFTEEVIEQHRMPALPKGKELFFAVALDPSGDDGEENESGENEADEIGIVTCCADTDGHFYVVADDTQNGNPAEWATAGVKAYNRHECIRMIYEKNYGGAMVVNTVRNVDGGDLVSMDGVTAMKGKRLRAEPISALYDQGRVHHIGKLHGLEDELTSWNGKGKSPNRLDAVVWCLTWLESYCKIGTTEGFGNLSMY